MNQLAVAVVVALSFTCQVLADEADVQAGLDLSIKFCARCHVIGDHNRLGGIGNSPSFPWMKLVEDYPRRFRTFYSLRPHPAFARVPGYLKWSNAPSYVPEFEITIDEIEKILTYVESLPVPE